MIYVNGREIILQTDHSRLVHLNSAKYMYEYNRIMRSAMFVQHYHLTVEPIKDCENSGADYLHRVISTKE